VPTARRARPAEPWLQDLAVPWRAEFMPSFPKEGYASAAPTLKEALTRPVAEGGFARDGRPVLVALYDASNPAHRRALASLDRDVRVRTAAHFFECLRIDAAPAAAGDDGVRVLVFDADGALRGETAGVGSRPSRVYDLLAAAFVAAGRDLGRECDRLDPLLKARARYRFEIRGFGRDVICADCGGRRDDVAAALATTRAYLADVDRRIAELAQKN
jgi:hypothetical protein